METPINLIMGRPTKTDDDPVMAKTIKIRMSSQRALTTHLCCNFFMKNTHTFEELKTPTKQS